MREVIVQGIGQTRVKEHWERSLRDLSTEAGLAAMRDAGVERIDAVFVGNMLSGQVARQENLGGLVADWLGQRGAEGFKVEAACASGAAAFRTAFLAVASGALDAVLAVGVEKMTECTGPETTAALATAADADFEGVQGITFVGLNALIMRRYMHEYHVEHEAFAPFVVNAHRNAVNNPYAMFRFPVSVEDFAAAKMIADPVNLLDSSPVCDGAAALVLCTTDLAKSFTDAPVGVRATAIATDTLALHDRANPLAFEAAAASAAQAYRQAEAGPQDISLFEVHDAFSITAVLALEACGFAERGRGYRLGVEGEIALGGRVPISTQGGLKARGHPVGATGVYQLAEVAHQLRGTAGDNQIHNPRLGMAQSIGGSAATASTTILQAPD